MIYNNPINEAPGLKSSEKDSPSRLFKKSTS